MPGKENNTVNQYEENDFRMLATTLYGLEEVLAAELLKLGAKNIEKLPRAVSFTGDKGFMYKANFCLRLATRVLKPIHLFRVQNEEDLYNKIKKIEWENYLHELDTLAVDTSLRTDFFQHSQFVSQKVKDAVVDRFRERTGKRPSVDLDRPWLRINIHIHDNECTVSLDSSGASLHKRGYRDQTNLAPLNEVLAAGLIALTGWNKRSAFIDPMCGSGTIVTEAALMAGNIPPGYYRKEFGFQTWKDYDDQLWELIQESALNKIVNEDIQIYGSDVSPNVTKKAKQNVKEARVGDMVTITTCPFEELQRPSEGGVIVMNPPYGERMDKDDINKLYKSIGDTLKKNWSGFDAWLITSNMEAVKQVGLRHSRRITVFNGGLECKFLKYEMYAGTKKVHKLGIRDKS
jgi:putative N6-adenine-specific DNA methylase